MTASANIKTPTMEVPLRSGKRALKQVKKLKTKFAKVTLSQVGYAMLPYYMLYLNNI